MLATNPHSILQLDILVATEKLLNNIAVSSRTVMLRGAGSDAVVVAAAAARATNIAAQASDLAARLRQMRKGGQLLGGDTTAAEKNARDTAAFLAGPDAAAIMKANSSTVPLEMRQPETWSRDEACANARTRIKLKPEVSMCLDLCGPAFLCRPVHMLAPASPTCPTGTLLLILGCMSGC